jgi:hypothetical protein
LIQYPLGRAETEYTTPSETTTIEYAAFSEFLYLERVVLPSVQTVAAFAFGLSSALTTVCFGASIQSLGANAFYSYASLTDIQLPASLTDIGDGCFQDCSALTEIALPENLASLGLHAETTSGVFSASGMVSILITGGIAEVAATAFNGSVEIYVRVLQRFTYGDESEASFVMFWQRAV